MPGVPPDAVAQVKKAFKSIFGRKSKNDGHNGKSSNDSVAPQDSTPASGGALQAQQQQQGPTAASAQPPATTVPETAAAGAAASLPAAPLPLTSPEPVKVEETPAKPAATDSTTKDAASVPDGTTSSGLTLTAPTGKEPAAAEQKKDTIDSTTEANMQHDTHHDTPHDTIDDSQDEYHVGDMRATSGPMVDDPSLTM